MVSYNIQNHKFRTQTWDPNIKKKLLQPIQLQINNNPYESSEPSRTSTINRKQPDKFGQTIPKNLKKEGICDGFEDTSKYLEMFSIKVSVEEQKNLPDQLYCCVDN